MSAAPMNADPQNWNQRHVADERPREPFAVRAAAVLLTIFGVLGVLRSALVLIGAAIGLRSIEPAAVLLLATALAGLAVSVGYLSVAKHLRLGKRWAWITTVVLLSIALLLGAVVLVGELSEGGFPIVGLVLLGVPALLLVALTASRRAREYFRRPPAGPAVAARGEQR